MKFVLRCPVCNLAMRLVASIRLNSGESSEHHSCPNCRTIIRRTVEMERYENVDVGDNFIDRGKTVIIPSE